MAVRPSPAKRWCFTINNYDEEVQAGLRRLGASPAVTYLIFGREVGEGGTRHLQGFVCLAGKKRLTQVKELLGGTGHLEKAKGTPGDNRTYCSKDGDVEEFGVCPAESSAATKLTDEVAAEVLECLRSGSAGVKAVETRLASQWLRNGTRFLANAALSVQPVARPDICVRWYWGEPGIGKSRRAHHEAESPYLKDARTKWWHGYLFERDVIIDDIAKDGIAINHLLRWFDRYPCYVETKGSQVALLARNIWVTSNFSVEEVFPDAHPDSIRALRRRMTVVHFVSSWQPTPHDAAPSRCC